MFRQLARRAMRGDERRGSAAVTQDLVITGHSGLVDGTRVSTSKGWTLVQELKPGDHVSTFDHGDQQIVEMQRETLYQAQQMLKPEEYPVHLPEGTLQNETALWLMPDQGVMVECDYAADSMGDPFAIIPAQAMVGFCGITQRMPPLHLRRTTLIFDQDEVIYADGGVLAHCPAPRRILLEGARISDGLYQVLDLDVSRQLVAKMAEVRAAAASQTGAADHI